MAVHCTTSIDWPLVVDFLGKVLSSWPLVIGLLLITFSEQIRQLLKALTKIKGPVGEFEFDQAALMAVMDTTNTQPNEELFAGGDYKVLMYHYLKASISANILTLIFLGTGGTEFPTEKETYVVTDSVAAMKTLVSNYPKLESDPAKVKEITESFQKLEALKHRIERGELKPITSMF